VRLNFISRLLIKDKYRALKRKNRQEVTKLFAKVPIKIQRKMKFRNMKKMLIYNKLTMFIIKK
jgi:hypothetical protein